MFTVGDHHVLSPRDLPHRENLRAAENLRMNKPMMSEFRGFSNDPDRYLNGLILSVMGFAKMKAATSCMCARTATTLLSKSKFLRQLSRMSIGSVTCHASSTELRWSSVQLSAYAVRVKGHVLALEPREVRNIPRWAQRSLRAPLCFSQKMIRVPLLGKSWN